MNKKNYIKPCPFCGEEPIYGVKVPSQYMITCVPCGVRMIQDREDKVIGMWNQRINND